MAYKVEDLIKVASKEIGVREVPDGSNRGPRVREYQAVTGAYGAPWCASFVQWCLQQVGGGPVANRSAGVFYIVDYARKHGWVVADPKPGDLIAFMSGLGHIGIVSSVRPGTILSVEGNTSNRVAERTHPRRGRYAFIRVPGQTKQKRWVWVPRFEIVTAENSNPKVVVPWGKWSVVGPKIPKKLAERRAVTLRRKLVKKET